MKRTILFLALVVGSAAFLTSCSKEYSFENGGAFVGNAVGSLKDTAGECLPDTVHGTFYDGVTPGTDTANVAIQVRVDSAGSYKIYTDLQNGFMFADSGYFTSTGMQTVYLKPVGIPILPVATNFTVTFDTSICGFTVYVQDSTGTGLGGGGNNQQTDSTNYSDTAWKFSNDTVNYHGHVDTAFIYDTVVSSINYYYLTIIGSTAGFDTSVEIGLYLPNGNIEPGTYTTNAGSGFYFVDNNTSAFIYSADYSLQPDFNVTFTITSVTVLDAHHKIVSGTYSGTAKDASGNTFNIASGSFKVNVYNP
jgi:hypothetical protein